MFEHHGLFVLDGPYPGSTFTVALVSVLTTCLRGGGGFVMGVFVFEDAWSVPYVIRACDTR